MRKVSDLRKTSLIKKHMLILSKLGRDQIIRLMLVEEGKATIEDKALHHYRHYLFLLLNSYA